MRDNRTVAPLVGAWIETWIEDNPEFAKAVAPLVGAWIETSALQTTSTLAGVAPLVGAWIETVSDLGKDMTEARRSPRGSVD